MNVGIDLMEIKRFRNLPNEKHNSFYMKLFTNDELEYCLKYSDPYPHFAGIFAAKEAVIKCLEKKVYFKEIEIQRTNTNKPFINICHVKTDHKISISHTQTIAIAIAIDL